MKCDSRWLAFALCFGVVAGCGPGPGSPSSARDSLPSILLISIDTLRPDHLTCYGYRRATSPNIDHLAATGVRFANAFSPSPWTLPAHTSLFTGLLPWRHGVDTDTGYLSPSLATLAEDAHRAGLATHALTTHVYVSPHFGLERGFDSFDFSEELPAATVTDRALAWLEARGGKPFLLFVHYFDCHWPYAPPASVAGRFRGEYHGPIDGRLDTMLPMMPPESRYAPADLQRLIDLYDEEIAGVDEQIGRLAAGITALGLKSRTWIVLTADHGEEFKDHGSLGHATALYDEQIRVPLIVSGPDGSGTGKVRDAPVSLLDLRPTIVELLGSRGRTEVDGGGGLAGIDGRSFAADLKGPLASPQGHAVRTLFAETARYGPRQVAIREGRWKYLTSASYRWFAGTTAGGSTSGVQLPTVEWPERLYDLEADPREETNLVLEQPERAARFRALASSYLAEAAPKQVLPAAAGQSRRRDASREAPASAN